MLKLKDIPTPWFHLREAARAVNGAYSNYTDQKGEAGTAAKLHQAMYNLKMALGSVRSDDEVLYTEPP